jgi:anti-sigma regulatory factor (Ser/Thr protein kinase)
MNNSLAIPIADISQVGEVRRLSVGFASKLGFSETERSNVAIIATEAAQNIVRHAGEGELVLQTLTHPSMSGIGVLALDRGVGMVNVEQCLIDGFSTIGTAGTGLGAIRRLATIFDIYSQPQQGTAVWVQLWPKLFSPMADLSLHPLSAGSVWLAKTMGEISGDAWAIEQQPDRSLILVADGLGSGPLAADAAQEAVCIFRANPQRSPQALLELMHLSLRKTRGAAVAIAEVLPAQQILRYAGVGNISSCILTGSASRSLVSYNGTVGHQLSKIAEFTYPWTAQSLLVMHSDGLSSHWSFNPYPGLLNRHPALIAGVLYRDFKRSRDDITVVVAKAREAR